MINDIYEQRKRLDEGYLISLSIPKEAYTSFFGNEVNEENAKDILENYLQHKDDDGEPISIKVYNHKESNLIEIEAVLNYIGNAHKEYKSGVSAFKQEQ